MIKPDSPLLERFQGYILENDLFHPEDKILLAVSGGVDSMLMANLFLRSGFNFGLAHCNFSLRGVESEGDEEFVRNWCILNNISFHTQRFDTHFKMQEDKISLQMAARALRYAWFESLCIENHYAYCSLAHHGNDILETILLNLVRGTGIAGLRGILPKSGIWIRPLLAFNKKEILDEAGKLNLAYREDSSNQSRKYLRNRLRQEVIPLLKEMNPNWEQTLGQHLKSLRFTEILASEKKKEIREDYWFHESGFQKLSIHKIREYGTLGSELLHTLLEPYLFTYSVCLEIWNHLEGQSGSFFYSKTHRIGLDRDFLILEPVFITPIPLPESANTPITGPLSFSNYFLGSLFHSFQITDSFHVNSIKRLVLQKNQQEISGEGILPPGPHRAYFDLETLGSALEYRYWKDGDSFFPLGMEKPKKLSDFFIDLKIPRGEKSRIPLVLHLDQIIWVVGYRNDHRYRITEFTRSILCIEYRNPQ